MLIFNGNSVISVDPSVGHEVCEVRDNDEEARGYVSHDAVGYWEVMEDNHSAFFAYSSSLGINISSSSVSPLTSIPHRCNFRLFIVSIRVVRIFLYHSRKKFPRLWKQINELTKRCSYRHVRVLLNYSYVFLLGFRLFFNVFSTFLLLPIHHLERLSSSISPLSMLLSKLHTML